MNSMRRLLGDLMTPWRAGWIALRRRVGLGAMLLVAIGLLTMASHEYLLTWFAYRFRAEDPPARSDAIVMLLGALDHSSKAADLYRRGLAPVILMCPTDDAWNEAQWHRGIMTYKGVPPEAIRSLPGEVVRGTHDEALCVRDFVRIHPIRRITLVTSAYHTARTRRTFLKVLRGTGVEVGMVASEPQFSETNWFTDVAGIKAYLLETLKTVYYRVVY